MIIEYGKLTPLGLKMSNKTAYKLLLRNRFEIDDDYTDCIEQFDDLLFDKYYVDCNKNVYIDEYHSREAICDGVSLYENNSGEIEYILEYDENNYSHDEQLDLAMNYYMKLSVKSAENKKGVVEIPRDFFNDNVDSLYEAFVQLKFIPMDVEHNWKGRSVIFSGLCESFDVVEEGSIIPEYNLIISTMEKGSVCAHFNKKGE